MAKKAAKQAPKGGLSYEEAMLEGMEVAQRAAKSQYKWLRSPEDRADVLQASYEAMLMAWAKWEPSRGPWGYCVKLWASEYARREANKKKSVVQTYYADSSKRKLERDAGIVSFTEDGETEMALPDDASSPEDQAAAREELAASYLRLCGVVEGMKEGRRAVAQAILDDRIFAQVPASVDDIAKKVGVSRPLVYRVEDAIRASL